MSSPPQGRALSFPIVWDSFPARPVSVPETLPAQSPRDDELLFDRYSRLVLGIALRILHDYGEAEDVVQEAFFRVFQRAKLFDQSKGTAKGWIVRIAFHRALDRKSYLDRRGFYLGTNIDSLDDTLLGETDLCREIGAKLNLVLLDKAFEELPEMQRRTLESFYFEGLTLREISEKLHEPLGNVRHHFYRGLERLRKSAFVQGLRGNER
jgi:RNA polymerase sigma-70 factor, ECF subfamily